MRTPQTWAKRTHVSHGYLKPTPHTNSKLFWVLFGMKTVQIIPEKLFYLVEDIRNIAQILNPRFKFIIHWIPSHIEHTSFGIKPIHGNIEADRLAKEAQNLAVSLDHPNNICIIRDKIFDYSASLISKIDALITSKSVPCDGPSSDDFSLSDAIRNFSRDVP